MSTKEDTKRRALLLKRLREKHKDSVASTKDLLKEQNAIRRQVCQPMRDGPKTVPELAKATGLPPDLVLWHVTAMKKYDLVMENGMCGEYYTYQRVEDKKK